jgi:hypothetical protein
MIRELTSDPDPSSAFFQQDIASLESVLHKQASAAFCEILSRLGE